MAGRWNTEPYYYPSIYNHINQHHSKINKITGRLVYMQSLQSCMERKAWYTITPSEDTIIFEWAELVSVGAVMINEYIMPVYEGQEIYSLTFDK